VARCSSRRPGLGLEVVSLGIRDVILPGEMKELMNKVIEAQKAAEAALITRREETAAMPDASPGPSGRPTRLPRPRVARRPPPR
jgi:hypothetical protein